MMRCKAIVCAGLLALTAGCVVDSMYLAWEPGRGTAPRYMLVGSVDGVSTATQATLEKLGLVVTVETDEGSVLLSSKTRSGAEFDLFLKQQVVNGEPATTIEMRWKSDPDHGFWIELLRELDEVRIEEASRAPAKSRPASKRIGSPAK